MRSGSRATRLCWCVALAAVRTSSLFRAVYCSSARGFSSGNLMFECAASAKGSIPHVRRSSTGSSGLSAFPTMLGACPFGTHGGVAGVAGAVDSARVPSSVVGRHGHLVVSLPFSSSFLQSLPWLQSLTSQMAPSTANMKRNVLNNGTTTTHGFGAKPLCVSNRSVRGPTLQGADKRSAHVRSAFGRGATAQRPLFFQPLSRHRSAALQRKLPAESCPCDC